MTVFSHHTAGLRSRIRLTSFNRFLISAGFANLGDGISTILWAWVASLLTRDPIWIAALPIALKLPWFLCSIPAGLLADRMDRHRLVVICDIARAGAYALGAAAVLAALPLVDPPLRGVVQTTLYTQLVLLALVVGTCEVIRDTTASSLLPRLIPDQDLEDANGKIYAVETVGNNLAGPALGALLIALFLPIPFAAIALLFLVSALMLRLLAPQLRTAPAPTNTSWRADLGEAFRFVVNHKGLRLLIIVSGTWCFFVEMGMIALLLHMQDNFGASSQTYGLTLAAGALGGVAGGYVTAPLLSRFKTAAVIRLSNLFDGLGFLIIAFAPSVWVIAAVLFVFYFTGVMWMTTVMTYRQREIPAHLFGRVNAISRLVAFGAMPLGLMTSGIVVNFAKTALPYETALIVPFCIAAFGLTLQVGLSWRAVGRRFPS